VIEDVKLNLKKLGQLLPQTVREKLAAEAGNGGETWKSLVSSSLNITLHTRPAGQGCKESTAKCRCLETSSWQIKRRYSSSVSKFGQKVMNVVRSEIRGFVVSLGPGLN